MFGRYVSELVLRWYVVDANLALFDQFVDVEEPQAHVFSSSTVGPITDEERGIVVDVQRCGLDSASDPSSIIMFEHTISFIASAAATNSASIVDMAISV